MKKILAILLIVFGLWYFYNLGQNQEAIKNAKKDLLNDKKTTEKIENNNLEKNTKIEENIDQQNKNKPSYKVENLDKNNFIEIDDLSDKVANITDKIKITGKVLNDEVDKIIVKFSNKTSDFANDIYTLKSFKKGNDTFEYNADSLTFQNLDYGENKYVIESYIGDKKSVVNIIINIPQDFEPSENSKNTKVTFNKKIIGDIAITLPEGGDFGKPLTLEDNKITYSNIKNLEIIKENFDITELTSENIWNKQGTGYLNKNINSYVYWNTFREINYSAPEAGISFYILRKSGDKFIYEKLYFDFKNKLKGVLQIEEVSVNLEEKISDQMAKLNNELKEKKSDFEEVRKTDKLFREIVR